jgi:acyl-CoA synthetase (AMP-forming)/AMP-acid ligase II
MIFAFTFQLLICIGKSHGMLPFDLLMDDDGKAFPENVDINPKEDVLVLPYSSGTTGLPKGVMLSHHNVIANVEQLVRWVTTVINFVGTHQNMWELTMLKTYENP